MLRRSTQVRWWTSAMAGAAVLILPALALALQPPQEDGARGRALLRTQPFAADELSASPSLTKYHLNAIRGAMPRALANFTLVHSKDWEVRWDERSDRPHLIQGIGIPLIPGKGNKLSMRDVGLGPYAVLDLSDVEPMVRSVIDQFPELFRVSQEDLVLDLSRSSSQRNGELWFLELKQVHRGVPVEGANVFFRINNGNLVQFGTDRVADVHIRTRPRISRAAALRSAFQSIGFRVSDISERLDRGTLKIYPVMGADEVVGEMYVGTPGDGYRHRLVWEYIFRRRNDVATYNLVVDALNGQVLRFVDVNAFATVTGGIYPVTNTDPEEVRGLPFANVTNGTAKVTDAAGIYNYTSGTATSTLNGRYIRMNDNCGAISLSNSTTGNLAFGTSSGTNCTTPGVGGTGNTHASRTGFYHLTRINRKAATFHPTNTWLNGTLQANMNINNTCNAFWNGSTVNFYRSGGGCSNTGEIAAVFLHEWGHGMDTNTGGSASDQGTGEAVGDTFAFLETRDGCIGQNFQPGVNCANCTACTGVRDVSDFDISGPAVIARPSNVANNSSINCDRFACPYTTSSGSPYRGPMGYEGHCESVIASSANWDLGDMLRTQFGTEAGWAAMDAIWYESLIPSKSAYRLVSGGTCNPSATVDGCGSTNWYTVYLAVDDDNGNLSDGTPNGCRIWDAFNAHGIACGARPACSGGGPTPTPTPTRTPTPTSPPGPTNTPTNTPTPPPGGAELLVNPGFEGSVSPWTASSLGAHWIASPGFPHSGSSYVTMGFDNSATGTLWQQVAIPTSATGTLSFWLNVTSNETTTTLANDQLFLEVRSTTGALLRTVATFSNLNKVATQGAYTQRGPFDISEFRGQTVRIQFRAVTNASLNTWFRTDDASLR